MLFSFSLAVNNVVFSMLANLREDPAVNKFFSDSSGELGLESRCYQFVGASLVDFPNFVHF